MNIIYTTPEFITNKLDLLISLKIYRSFAKDEAMYHNGCDFRESYQQLGIIKQTFTNIPLLAVTATATPRVLEEMYEFLNVSEAEQYSLGTRRNNLAIKVLPKKDFVDCKFDQPTIIYTQTRKLAESLCNDICSKGIKCHIIAGMKVQEKQKVMKNFLRRYNGYSSNYIIWYGYCKSDIRHVVNYGIPTDIETYYQEIGRAGRDGIMSKATIYYQDSDFVTARFLISKSSDPNQIKIKTDALNTFSRYLNENIMCRQQIIDYYFEKGSFPTENDVHMQNAKYVIMVGVQNILTK